LKNVYAGIKFIPLVIAGIATLVWSLPASHRLKAPYDIAAALLTIIGVVLFVIGILLTFIPKFFR